jgi:uncharacterized protein involved in exopolysaccharide biosynthesis
MIFKSSDHDLLLKDKIDIFYLLFYVQKRLKTTLAFLLCFISLGFIYIFSTPNIYMSDSLLTINSGQSKSSLPSSFGGIASLAGIAMPAQEIDSGDIAKETIFSKDFFRHLITFDGVIQSILNDKYDDYSDPAIFNEAFYKYKTELIKIDYRKKTGFLYIQVFHMSPSFSQSMLVSIIRELNKRASNKAASTSGAAIEYLSEQLAINQYAEIDNAISGLIKNQLEIQMMSSISEEYLLKTLDPPSLPIQPFAPKKKLVLFLSLMLGVAFNIIYLLFMACLSRYNVERVNYE